MFLVGPIRNVRWSSLKLLANWWIANQETTRLASSVSSLLYRNLHNNVSIGDKDAEIKRVRIYTRTGDKGKSSLLTGERRPKDDAVFEVLGTLDELNAQVGLSAAHCRSLESSSLIAKLEDIQSSIFDIGAAVASHSSKSEKVKGNLEIAKFRFHRVKVERLEKWIDELEESLPPLRNFILPSGGLASAQLHITRAVARRAERRFWTAFYHTLPLIQDSEDQVKTLQCVGQYLNRFDDAMNRLGDFLFVAARVAAQETGNSEVLYKGSS